ncbi:NYN domain-containing protein [Variovorax sp. AB1(2024)]|uniref:NYN domain-containing protein n=1 Tax=Variovorax sp. AB1(2024) TaxID=3132214 RepID=UPI003095AD22
MRSALIQNKSYLFIDGAYLTQAFDDLSKKWFDGVELPINYSLLALNHQKVFYYDCLPAQKDGESNDDFSIRKLPQERKFETLRNLNGWHVNEGIAKHRKRQGAQQKEVDILIAVDMLSHTHRRNMERLTFIAGDQDFCPLIEAVVREGMFVELFYDPTSVSKDLKNSADSTRKLDLLTAHQLLDPRFIETHPIPTRSNATNPGVANATAIRTGTREGELFALLFKHEAGLSIINQKTSTGYFARLDGGTGDETRLIAVHADLYGPVDWQ